MTSPHIPTRLFKDLSPELVDRAEASVIEMAQKRDVDLALIQTAREKAEVDDDLASLDDDEWAAYRIVSTAVGRLTFDVATPDMIALTDENFEELALDPRGDMLVQFTVGWCGPCHRAAPILNEVAARGMRVGKLDCELAIETARRFAVVSYPTFVLFTRGGLTAIFRGDRTIEAVEGWLSQFRPTSRAA